MNSMNGTEFAAPMRGCQTFDAESLDGHAAGEDKEFMLDSVGEPDELSDGGLHKLDTCGLVELLLKNRQSLHRILRDRSLHALLLPRFLAIALVGFVLFGVAMALLLSVSDRWPALTAIATWLEAPAVSPISFERIASPLGALWPWTSGQAFVLTGAYAFGLVAASGVALPSLYFYCLLAGVRMTMLEVVIHAVKAKAVAAVALVGILPIYVAIAMGVVIFDFGDHWLRATLYLGLILPFIAGLWGTASLYQGFLQLCEGMPAERKASRACFLRRLVLSWAACYSAIMPVMIYSLWQVLSGS